ncbi:MAG: hypothetical protein HY801_03770 [Candidatus Lindowbacteria bacterium]|nr:hypothetical protein [Candidatus Lindowbacteria bacterium]
MKSKYRMLVFILVGLALIGVTATAREEDAGKTAKGDKAETTVKETPATNKSVNRITKLSAILLVNSVSCQCTREQCAVAEKIVKRLRADYGDVISFETIDYEPQLEKAKPIIERYEAYMIASLLVLDKEKRLV